MIDTYPASYCTALEKSTDAAVKALLATNKDAFKIISRNVVDDMVDEWNGAKGGDA